MRDLRVVRQAVWAAVPVAALLLTVTALPAAAQEAAKEPAYRAFPLIGSRLAVWAVAQLHLNFAAFILGVPIFAVIIEIIGWRTRQEQYDWLSHEFVKLIFAAFSTTALLGAFLLFLFVGYYPKFWTYMTSIFFPTYWIYALLFFAETFTVYLCTTAGSGSADRESGSTWAWASSRTCSARRSSSSGTPGSRS